MSTSTATKEFEFEGCVFTCIATVSSHTQYHPYGSTVAGEQMTELEETKWLFDGEPISEGDVEHLVGGVEDWIEQTVAEGAYANEGPEQEQPEWDD